MNQPPVSLPCLLAKLLVLIDDIIVILSLAKLLPRSRPSHFSKCIEVDKFRICIRGVWKFARFRITEWDGNRSKMSGTIISEYS